jgi:hypothetical protein
MHRPRLTVLGCLFVLTYPIHGAEPVRVVPADTVRDARQPQVAVSPAGKVFIIYGAGDVIHCSISPDGGKSFNAPVKVGEAGVMALGRRRGPRVAAADKAIVVTAICGKQGKGQDGDVLAWRSADEGKTWKGPVKINRVEGSAREGLHSLAASPDGTMCCVWLDIRANKGQQVYGATSTDGGATWQPDKLVYASPDDGICPCCQPVVAYDLKGGLHVMWRNSLADNRDMWLISSYDGGKTFGKAGKLGSGTWPLTTCPMDGGGLAGDAEGRLLTIWMRKKETFQCIPGQPEKSLGPGQQGWAAASSEGFYLVWITARPGTLLALTPGADRPIKLADNANDPVVAAATNGKGPVIAAWEEGHGANIQIRAVILSK